MDGELPGRQGRGQPSRMGLGGGADHRYLTFACGTRGKKRKVGTVCVIF